MKGQLGDRRARAGRNWVGGGRKTGERALDVMFETGREMLQFTLRYNSFAIISFSSCESF